MFEYTALVDAPVQRFTGIVTGPEPVEDLAPEPPRSPATVAEPAVVETHLEVGEAPGRSAAPLTVTPTPDPKPVDSPPPMPAVLAAAASRSVERPATSSSASPSFIPALIGAAVAGVTAMWWLRRDSHHRAR
jgi:hypothetical protein